MVEPGAPSPVIVWFRQDLRLTDNPALHAAAALNRAIVPLFILDDEAAGSWAPGAASRWWLHHALKSLSASLNNALVIRRGGAGSILPQIVRETGAGAVYWNRIYEPWAVERDEKITAALQEDGVDVQSFNGFLLFEPGQVLKEDGTPYKVFTPFHRACMAKGEPAPPLPAPEKLRFAGAACPLPIESLGLLPTTIRWDEKMAQYWTPGEKGAMAQLEIFLDESAATYKSERDRPDHNGVSRQSPHLHFGEISPRQIWHKTGDRSQSFLRQLMWREFSWNLLHDNPDMPEVPLKKSFEAFKWNNFPHYFKKWQQGQTGYPIVDAGMRELWETGWMHNRVRMIAASFLIKDLLIDWRWGQKWFWDTLVDADLANNSSGWQWVAGCGADASPFFRIFNPNSQGQKFDPEGDYVRRWVPELKDMPRDFIHAPHEAHEEVLRKAGVRLGKDYPMPMVDHQKARLRALEALAWLKES